jgi:hypothetical protein
VPCRPVPGPLLCLVPPPFRCAASSAPSAPATSTGFLFHALSPLILRIKRRPNCSANHRGFATCPCGCNHRRRLNRPSLGFRASRAVNRRAILYWDSSSVAPLGPIFVPDNDTWASSTALASLTWLETSSGTSTPIINSSPH